MLNVKAILMPENWSVNNVKFVFRWAEKSLTWEKCYVQVIKACLLWLVLGNCHPGKQLFDIWYLELRWLHINLTRGGIAEAERRLNSEVWFISCGKGRKPSLKCQYGAATQPDSLCSYHTLPGKRKTAEKWILLAETIAALLFLQH